MKVFIKLLFASIISASSCFNLLAQQEFSPDSVKVSEEIATGHVFVDGVYIEPPYIVRKEGWKIFINDILVFDYQKPRSLYSLAEKPKANFGELDKTSTLKDIYKVKDTINNLLLVNSICFYYIEKFEYSVACDSIVEFYKTLANVKSFKKHLKDDCFEMISYNNDTLYFSLEPFGRHHSESYGPKNNIERQKEIDRGVNSTFIEYYRDLQLEKLLVVYSSEGRRGGFQRLRINYAKIKDFCNILLSEDNHKQKVDLLTNIVMDRVFAEKVVTTLVDKSILIRILEQTSIELENKTE